MTATHIEVRKWTTEEFERLVFDCKPKTAVFDCDGTLWAGDAGYGFMAWTLEQGLVSRSTHDWIDNRYRDYKAGHVSEAAMCGEMVQIYAGLREAELRAAAANMCTSSCAETSLRNCSHLVARLRSAGVEFWAVSSTNRWVVAEGARHFGIPAERVLAASVHVKAGIITSEIIDVPTDEAKSRRSRRGHPVPDAVFGNSIHDLPMLEIARSRISGESVASIVRSGCKEWLGLLQAEGRRGRAYGQYSGESS